MNRRNFLITVGAAAGAGLAAGGPVGARTRSEGDDMYGVLIDLSRCVGCRTCEAACAEANGLAEPDDSDAAVRLPSDRQWAAVSRYETSKGEVFVKRQCMHCIEPACAAACLTKALRKTAEGPVVWDGDKCMGCRYCMLSCPFDMPKFEYMSANPKIQKCQLCYGRLQEGQVPACVENCPAEALTFGKRAELIEIARQRIYQNPGQYVPEIYGEHEAGGTSTLYISPVPFAELGFRTDLDNSSYPELTTDFLTAVPLVLVAWPAFLASLRQSSGAQAEAAGEVAVGHHDPGASAPEEDL